MTLYAVVVQHVYPPQCVAVWDRQESAQALSDHLNVVVAPHTIVQEVEEFFPRGHTDADETWINATNAYLRGDHINTSGE